MEYQFKFHFGVKKITSKEMYITALLCKVGVDILSHFSKLSPEDVWALIDEFAREHNIRRINELILSTPELLSNRIERDVDKAIENYKNVVEYDEPEIVPIFTETEEGEMRIRAPWIKE